MCESRSDSEEEELERGNDETIDGVMGPPARAGCRRHRATTNINKASKGNTHFNGMLISTYYLFANNNC
jgi:hypothetical protein